MTEKGQPIGACVGSDCRPAGAGLVSVKTCNALVSRAFCELGELVAMGGLRARLWASYGWRACAMLPHSCGPIRAMMTFRFWGSSTTALPSWITKPVASQKMPPCAIM